MADPDLELELSRALAARPLAVPPDVDARLAAAARAADRRRLAWRVGGAGAVLAAAAALALALAPARGRRVAHDWNGDGRFDVLDAYRLARGVEAGAPPPDADLNHDGRVNAADVALAARAVVRL